MNFINVKKSTISSLWSYPTSSLEVEYCQFAFEEDRKAYLEAGMNEHIGKPINLKQLKKALAT